MTSLERAREWARTTDSGEVSTGLKDLRSFAQEFLKLEERVRIAKEALRHSCHCPLSGEDPSCIPCAALRRMEDRV